MLDNAEWLTKLNYIEMLRDVGRHFSVNRMLTMDSVRLRLEREQEMSFIEFNYMICQAYDFVELARRTGCNLQMGGSDQWGNIVMGVDLGRRMGTHQLYALTTPLLRPPRAPRWARPRRAPCGSTRSRCRPTTSGSTGATPRMPTWPSSSSCSRRCRWRRSPGSPRCRAPRSTRPRRCWRPRPPPSLHGRDKAEAAARTAQQTFEQGALAEGLPTVEIAAAELSTGSACSAPSSRQASSSPTARRGARLPAAACGSTTRASRDESAKLTASDVSGGVIKLSLGKKRHVLLKPV